MSNHNNLLSSNKPQFIPSSIEIELFAKDLMKCIEIIVSNVTEKSSRDLSKVRYYFEPVINNLIENWSDVISLETTHSSEWGLNLNFEGPTGPYSIPTFFWQGRNSLKINLRSYKRWIKNLPYSMTWDKFQLALYELLYNETIPNLGITRRHLEIIRFQARLEYDILYFTSKATPEQLRKYYQKYNSVYDKKLNINTLIKDYPSIVEQYFLYDAIPLPDAWNLDCVFVNKQTDTINENNKIASLPIWTFKGLDDSGKPHEFTLHRINAGSISHNDAMYNNLIKKAYFFWNFGHFNFLSEQGKRLRCQLMLKPIKDLYALYEEQNFKLYDILNDDNKTRVDNRNSVLYSPEWKLELNFPFTIKNSNNNTFSDSQAIKNKTKIIKSYNLRFVDDKNTFFNFIEQYTTKNLIDLLFGYRIYFNKLPASNKVLMWIPLVSTSDKALSKKLIPFFMSWLYRGPIFEYNNGILIISYFSLSNISKSFIQELKNFLRSFNLEVYVFVNKDIQSISTLSIYHLPESYFFDKNLQTWNLPERKLILNANEKTIIINKIADNEQKYPNNKK